MEAQLLHQRTTPMLPNREATNKVDISSSSSLLLISNPRISSHLSTDSNSMVVINNHMAHLWAVPLLLARLDLPLWGCRPMLLPV